MDNRLYDIFFSLSLRDTLLDMENWQRQTVTGTRNMCVYIYALGAVDWSIYTLHQRFSKCGSRINF